MQWEISSLIFRKMVTWSRDRDGIWLVDICVGKKCSTCFVAAKAFLPRVYRQKHSQKFSRHDFFSRIHSRCYWACSRHCQLAVTSFRNSMTSPCSFANSLATISTCPFGSCANYPVSPWCPLWFASRQLGFFYELNIWTLLQILRQVVYNLWHVLYLP